jgi:hypothetical protein
MVARKTAAQRPVAERPFAEKLVVQKMVAHRPVAQEEQWRVAVRRIDRGRGIEQAWWGIEVQESGFQGKWGWVVRCGG